MAGFHLFPFRTEKLSPPAPMVLHTRGRVGSRRLFFRKPLGAIPGAFVVVYTPSPRAGSGPVLTCQQLHDMLSLPIPSSLMILGFMVRPDISSPLSRAWQGACPSWESLQRAEPLGFPLFSVTPGVRPQFVICKHFKDPLPVWPCASRRCKGTAVFPFPQ